MIDIITFFIKLMLEVLAIFLIANLFLNIFFIYVSKNKIEKLMGRKGISSNIIGAIFASITPLCTCSTIPIMIELLKRKVSFSTVITFLIASPLINPIIIVMLASLISIKIAILYFIIIFVLAILFGLLVGFIGGEKLLKSKISDERNQCSSDITNIPKKSFLMNITNSFKESLKNIKSLFLYIFIGIFLATAIYAIVPKESLFNLMGGNNLISIALSSVVAIPFYIRIETAIPIGLSLLDKGISLGSMVAFIVGGSGMAIPEIVMLNSIFKIRLVSYIVLIIFITSVFTGYIINLT